MNSQNERAEIPLVISTATQYDCPKCAELLSSQLTEHGIDSSAEPMVGLLLEIVANPERGILLVAKTGGQMIGIAYAALIFSAEHCGTAAWLEELYVSPQHRGSGIGTQLLLSIIDAARKGGAKAIDLEIVESHERVVSLYQRFNFTPLNRERWGKVL